MHVTWNDNHLLCCGSGSLLILMRYLRRIQSHYSHLTKHGQNNLLNQLALNTCELMLNMLFGLTYYLNGIALQNGWPEAYSIREGIQIMKVQWLNTFNCRLLQASTGNLVYVPKSTDGLCLVAKDWHNRHKRTNLHHHTPASKHFF